MGGDIIVVVLGENVGGVPEGYSVYTELELEKLCRNGVDKATLQLLQKMANFPDIVGNPAILEAKSYQTSLPNPKLWQLTVTVRMNTE